MDSRDLQKEIDELETLKEENGKLSVKDLDNLNDLLELKNESEDYGWEYGINFIIDFEFEDYCRELAEDCYILNNERNPLLNYIDWESWARARQMYYFDIKYKGNIYYYRKA